METKRVLPILYRDFDVEVLEREVAAEPEVGKLTRHPFAVSSEREVERFDFWTGKRWIEVLGHDPGEIDARYLKNGLAVLDRHYGDQIGIFEDGTAAGKKLRGDIIFSRGEVGKNFERDVVDGIRKSVSVGYRILKAQVLEIRDGIEVRRATKWVPMEVSLVPIGADPTAGHKRDQGREELYEVEIEGGEPAQEERTMKPENTPATTEPAAATRAADPPAPAAAASLQVTTTAERNAEAAEIFELATLHGQGARAPEWIRQGLSKRDVGLEILKAKQTRGFGQPGAEQLPGDAKDLKRYSYVRAIQQCLEMRVSGRAPDGLEGELHQELLKRRPPSAEYHGGLMMPMRTRALDSKTAGKGLELVGQDQGDLIELLRTRTAVIQLGAQVLSGLTAPVAFPKQTSGMTVFWVSENPGVDVTDTDLGTGVVLLTPKTVMGMGKISRQLIAQASVDAEGMVENELVAADARAIDKAAIHGSGVSGQPQGIYIAPDVNVVAMGGVPTFGKIVDMAGLVADKDADLGALGYLTTPLMAAKMKQTLVASAAGSDMVWEGTFQKGIMAGYPATATNQVSKTLVGGAEHGLIFGNWADIVIGFWEGLEITVDPYTLAGQAMLRIISYHLADIIIRHGQSFTKATGATIT